MAVQMDEKQLLTKLGIDSIQDITPANVTGVLNMLPILDPAVASKILDFILSLPDTAKELTRCFKEVVEDANDANCKVALAVTDADRAIIDSFLRQSERADFSPEERADIRNKVMEISTRMTQTDTRNKGFLDRLVDGAKENSGWILGGLLALAGFVVGGKIISNNHKT